MRERDVEAALVRQTKRLGGEAYKWSSPGRRGVPDRIVMLPGGKVCAVEIKRPGSRPTTLQERTLERLRALGMQTAVVDTQEAVTGLLHGLCAEIGQ